MSTTMTRQHMELLSGFARYIQQRTILVVDEDEAILATLGALIRDEGYCVDFARDGEVALDYLAAHSPQLVFVEPLMRRSTGGEFAREVRRRFPQHAPPIVFISSASSLAAEAARLEVHHLRKPLSVSEVRRATGLWSKPFGNEWISGSPTAPAAARDPEVNADEEWRLDKAG